MMMSTAKLSETELRLLRKYKVETLTEKNADNFSIKKISSEILKNNPKGYCHIKLN